MYVCMHVYSIGYVCMYVCMYMVTYVSHGAHELGPERLDEVVQVRAGARHADHQCVVVHIWVLI